jgi:outer membrane protein TolC
LAEPFDLNYYNALVAGSEAGRAAAAQNHADSIRTVRRSLNLEDSVAVDGKVDLAATLPELNEESAMREALAGRIDYRLAMKAVRDAELKVQISGNGSLPDLVGQLGVSAMGQQDALNDAASDTLSMKYPSWQARLSLRYAFGDTEQQAGERDARVALQNAKTVLQRTEREVRDDVQSRIGQIRTSHLAYVKAREARIESERYYAQLLLNLRRGRFSATTVKQALDALIDSRQRELAITGAVQYFAGAA